MSLIDRNNYCFRGMGHTSGRPMLLALVKPDNMTSNSTFYKVCTEVSTNLNFFIIRMFSSTSLRNCLKLLVCPKHYLNSSTPYLSLLTKLTWSQPRSISCFTILHLTSYPFYLKITWKSYYLSSFFIIILYRICTNWALNCTRK